MVQASRRQTLYHDIIDTAKRKNFPELRTDLSTGEEGRGTCVSFVSLRSEIKGNQKRIICEQQGCWKRRVMVWYPSCASAIYILWAPDAGVQIGRHGSGRGNEGAPMWIITRCNISVYQQVSGKVQLYLFCIRATVTNLNPNYKF